MLLFSVLLLATSALAASRLSGPQAKVTAERNVDSFAKDVEHVVADEVNPAADRYDHQDSAVGAPTDGPSAVEQAFGHYSGADHLPYYQANAAPKSNKVFDQGFVHVQPHGPGVVQSRHQQVPSQEADVGVFQNGVYQQAEPVSQDPAARAQVLRQQLEVNYDGSFLNSWNSDNGINVHEQGNVKRVGDSDSVVQQGDISYVDNDGNQFHLKYVADENGFHVEGDHLPTPPPIPPAIARSLEYLAAHPYVETTTESQEEDYRHEYQRNPQ